MAEFDHLKSYLYRMTEVGVRVRVFEVVLADLYRVTGGGWRSLVRVGPRLVDKGGGWGSLTR